MLLLQIEQPVIKNRTTCFDFK